MGKGASILTGFSGKVGNVVGYSLKNSNNKVTQATRAYVADVNNPMSEAQAIARMKVAPVNNFYRALNPILDNSWQGTKYGQKSLQLFKKLTFGQTTGIPFVTRNEKRFFPAEYPVSVGSLPSVSVSFDAELPEIMMTSIKCPEITDQTWGELSQQLVNLNFGLKNGYKITFIAVLQREDGTFLALYTYVILDVTSQLSYSDVFDASHMGAECERNGFLFFASTDIISGPCVAGAVIVSCLDTSGKWLRSSSTMACSEAYKAQYMGVTAYRQALASYMRSSEIASTWYLNQGISGSIAAGGGSAEGGTSSNVTVVSIENNRIRIGQSQVSFAVRTMSDGTRWLAVVEDDEQQYYATVSGNEYYYSGSAVYDENTLTRFNAAGANLSGIYMVEAILVQ